MGMGRELIKILLIVAVVAGVIALLLKLTSKKGKTTGNQVGGQATAQAAPTLTGPGIIVRYRNSNTLLEDGKCGWLDIEGESGDSQTVKLDFNKKAPQEKIIPLATGAYRITYRTQSKAAMLASNVMASINESNGAMGAFANAVYDAGGMSGAFESVVVRVENGFVLKLVCSTDGVSKSCEIDA